MSIALILTIAGVIRLKAVRTRAARQQAIAAQPATQTVDETITGERPTTAPARKENTAAGSKPP